MDGRTSFITFNRAPASRRTPTLSNRVALSASISTTRAGPRPPETPKHYIHIATKFIEQFFGSQKLFDDTQNGSYLGIRIAASVKKHLQ